jgi:glutamate-1-semialdehyde 2,1-aminomutase
MVNRTNSERSTTRSKELHDAACELFPGGVSHNVRYVEPYPVYFDSTDGATFTDVDGNEYVDFWMNHHTSVLGHGHPEITAAVAQQVQDDLHYGAPNEKAIELARRVQEFVPSMERMRFCSSGTEATMYAVRLARAYTNRNRVLKVRGGWHGGNTDLAKDVYPPFDEPTTVGLPPGAAEHVHSFRLNDRAAVDALLDEHKGEVAAVILDPRKGGTPPDDEFLRYLKEQSEQREFLLIFDEVVTGFRVSPGSYQARVGVHPDLTALGKCLGGELPVGALAGRAELFDAARPDIDIDPSERIIAGGGTFSVNPMTLTAGNAMLSVIENESVHEHTESLGQQLRNGLTDVFEDAGVDATMLGLSSLVLPAFNPQRPLEAPEDVKEATDSEALEQFHNRLLDHGYYFLPGHMGNVSYQTTEDHIEGVIDAASQIVPDMRADGIL